jgi:tRNA nucleotidyltransferase/poly(A) polymerase
MEAYNHCKAELEKLTPEALRPKPFLTGNDLIQMGIPQGPRIGEILRQIEDAQLEGVVTTEDQARALAASH